MTYTTTTNLGLHVIDYNTEKETWGTLYGLDMAAIDAFAGKVPVKLSSGVVLSSTTTTLALSISVDHYKLFLDNTGNSGVAVNAFLRFGNGTASPVTSANYDYARHDLSAKSSGTMTYAAGIGATSILLTDAIKNQSSDTADGAMIEIDIFTKLNVLTARTVCKWTASYKNNDGSGYRVDTAGSGALLGQGEHSTAVTIGGFNSDHTPGLAFKYALFAIPGLT